MADYLENGYSVYLNIDSLTPKLGTFGNETINSGNIDSFIEEDALPEGGLPVVNTGYNVNINLGRVEIRNGTTVLGYLGIGSTVLSEFPDDPVDVTVLRTDNLIATTIDVTGGFIYTDELQGSIDATLYIRTQDRENYGIEISALYFDPNSDSVWLGLGKYVPWHYIRLRNAYEETPTPSANDGMIEYYNDGVGTVQFRGYLGSDLYSFDMTIV